MFMRFPLKPPAPVERSAEAASKNIVEPCGPLHRIFRQKLLYPIQVKPSAVKYPFESLDELVSMVAYYAEKVHDVPVYIIINFNRARGLVEEKVGRASEHLDVNMVWRNQRQKRLQKIVLSADVGEEAEPSQHNVGMTKLVSLI